ncbi:glycosyl hydrolase family 28-related protein [Streptococcus merionis]|uniref:Cell wall surface anchor family protein n=1 Tax=Streptococcus merionis TaxID=400065 RepID=A0A239SV82_9STRE|nr:glycosyl hydrolase family 28-related protein [Streptococcus merionis]SNU88718.1 cell wall surface anchor family protein [Streptococcus merionis]
MTQFNKQNFSIRKLSVGGCSAFIGLALFSTTPVFANEASSIEQDPSLSTSQLTEIENTQNNSEGTLGAEMKSARTSDEIIPKESGNTELILSDEALTQEESLTAEIRQAGNEGNTEQTFSNEPLNIKTQYGAIGDGIADDRKALQDAIDAASTGLGGGIVYLPEGTYRMEEIIFLKSNIHVQLHEKATILNYINQKDHPSIVFMTGEFTDDGKQVEWAPTENITFTGGTIDMNGQLNAEGTKAKNLPLINSSGAFAIGNSTNVTIRDVTFKDSYKGHAIQIAGSKNVLIDNSRFIGQALPNTLKDSQLINYESIQIEPLTRKGFPYALNNTGAKSENITIQNSYFGKSNTAGELVTAIGTHYQDMTTENPENIKILNNHFDNMVYAGIRFTGFTNVLIQGNHFTKKAKEDSIHYREKGATLVNGYSYNNKDKSHVLDLNKHITVTENTFDIADSNTKSIRFAKDNAQNLGEIRDIAITNNTITYTHPDSKQPAIQTLRVVDNLTITGNTILGGYQGITLAETSGATLLANNIISNVSDTYMDLSKLGSNQTIHLKTQGAGTIELTTDDNQYHFLAKSNSGFVYAGLYSDPVSKQKISDATTYSIPINEATTSSLIFLFNVLSKEEQDVSPKSNPKLPSNPQNNRPSPLNDIRITLNTTEKKDSSPISSITKKAQISPQSILPRTGQSTSTLTLLGSFILLGVGMNLISKKDGN